MGNPIRTSSTGSLPKEDESVIRVCTWNIGGGLIDEGSGSFSRLNLDYFSEIIRSLNADIVFLQESHTYRNNIPSQASIISDRTEHIFFIEQPISESHLTQGANLSLAILANSRFFDINYVELPNPNLRSVGPDGKLWTSFNKGILTAKTCMRGQNVSLANAHLFPLHHFDRDPKEDEFVPINKRFTNSIENICINSPFIMGADLNMDAPFETVPSLTRLNLSSALPNIPTTPTGLVNDYIIINEMLHARDSGVYSTLADHYVCWSDLNLVDVQ